MRLSPGTHIGAYEILEPLGAGGIGEVYKAHDPRLHRTVALKILSPSLADDPTWRLRFDREARLLAAMTHPHICAVFDVGSENQTNFMVMEYIEGETLAARLAKGPLPVDQMLRTAAEVADGLAQAHRQSVCHRDLKPANIMLTRAGAKLLDFGLARDSPPLAAVGADRQTISADLTEKGIILGTIGYMAPEQLEGRTTDTRSDIFAFGAVLYEMATGRKAFAGQSQAGIIATILDSDPSPVSSVRPMLPPALDHVVQKCLAKDPENRWQHAADLRDELKWIAQQGSDTRLPTHADRRWKKIALLSGVLASLLLVTLIVLAVVEFGERAAAPLRMVFTVPRPHSAWFWLFNFPVISPDGTRLLFAAPAKDGRLLLWSRALDSLTAQPIDGTESNGGPFPFWSPDGRFVGFFSDGKLKTIDPNGGSAQTIADAPNASGGSWGPDGTNIYAPQPGRLYRVSAAGGPATPLRELDASRREWMQLWPHFLPDGKHYLYAGKSADPEKTGIYLGTVGMQESRLLIRGETNGVYSPPGYLIFVRDGSLLAQAFDLGTLQLANEAFPLPSHGGESSPALGSTYGLFSVSQNGILAYAGRHFVDVQPTWYDRGGKVLGAIGEPGEYATVTLSPDEKRVALERTGARPGVWLLDVATGIATKLRFNSLEGDPVWSPDSRELVISDYRSGINNLHRKVIGRNDEELLLASGEDNFAQEWTRDGASILFIEQGGRSLYRLPLSGPQKPERLLHTPFANDQFHISPDGRWIAFNSQESGRWEVYVASFPSFADKRQVSRDGGCQPLWGKDGKELFYLSLQGKLMSVDTTIGATFDAGVPSALFQAPISVNPAIDQYGVTRDGQRFIFPAPIDSGSAEPITVMVNWAAGLKPSQGATRAPQ
jgi:Tol biopolymer transport system component